MDNLENLEHEEWRDIRGYEGYYQVSNKGRVKSLKRMRLLRGSYYCQLTERLICIQLKKTGYCQVTLFLNRKRKYMLVHRLVVEAFIGEIPAGCEVDHIDNNRANNCLENLQIVTRSQNGKLKFERGYVCPPNPNSKKVVQISKEAHKPIRLFNSTHEVERLTGIDQSQINQCCLHKKGYDSAGGYIWEYLENLQDIEAKMDAYDFNNNQPTLFDDSKI